MISIFKVVAPTSNAEQPRLYKSPDRSAEVIEIASVGAFVQIDPDAQENKENEHADFVFVNYRRNKIIPGNSGWFETRFLGESIGDLKMPPMDAGLFVRDCARHEILSTSGGDAPSLAILADYLIALAVIESELTIFETRLEGTDAIGPYQHTSAEWDEFIAANPDGQYDRSQRFFPLFHIPCAAYIAERDWEEFAKVAAQDGKVVDGQPYIPSFLSLFHARLVGVEAAFALLEVQNGSTPNTRLEEVLAQALPDSAVRDALIARRKRFLRPTATGPDTTVSSFFHATAATLDDAFREALRLLRLHLPKFADPPASTRSPWMKVAEQELAFFDNGKLDEKDPKANARIIEYFKSTDTNTDRQLAWCGAFVAHCMKNCGDPRAEQSIVHGAASAVNWKAWGDRELRHQSLGNISKDVLNGAVIVIKAPADGSSSGHVTFGLTRVIGFDRIQCLGGNQGNTVKIDTFSISEIAAIRVMDESLEEPGGDDVDVLARTVFGEARGEIEQGQKAVANVIMNRKNSGRFRDSVKGVCLQPFQFSCWNEDDPNRAKILALKASDSPIFSSCLKLSADAMQGKINVVPPDSFHYHATSINVPKWVTRSPNAKVVARIGNHVFYSGIA